MLCEILPWGQEKRILQYEHWSKVDIFPFFGLNEIFNKKVKAQKPITHQK